MKLILQDCFCGSLSIFQVLGEGIQQEIGALFERRSTTRPSTWYRSSSNRTASTLSTAFPCSKVVYGSLKGCRRSSSLSRVANTRSAIRICHSWSGKRYRRLDPWLPEAEEVHKNPFVETPVHSWRGRKRKRPQASSIAAFLRLCQKSMGGPTHKLRHSPVNPGETVSHDGRPSASLRLVPCTDRQEGKLPLCSFHLDIPFCVGRSRYVLRGFGEKPCHPSYRIGHSERSESSHSWERRDASPSHVWDWVW